MPLYILYIDDIPLYPGMLSFSYAQQQYELVLQSIRLNLIDATVKLVRRDDNKIFFNSNNKLWKISPWSHLKLSQFFS